MQKNEDRSNASHNKSFGRTDLNGRISDQGSQEEPPYSRKTNILKISGLKMKETDGQDPEQITGEIGTAGSMAINPRTAPTDLEKDLKLKTSHWVHRFVKTITERPKN